MLNYSKTKAFSINIIALLAHCVLQLTIITRIVPVDCIIVKDDVEGGGSSKENDTKRITIIDQKDYEEDYPDYDDNNLTIDDYIKIYRSNITDDIINRSCYLPNQKDTGNCVFISNCLAYLKVFNNYSEITAKHVNFLKQVQCKSYINFNEYVMIKREPSVCCPTNGNDYYSPQIEFSINERGRILVGNSTTGTGATTTSTTTTTTTTTATAKTKNFKRRIQKVENLTDILFDNDCGKQVTNRIYGGEIAELDEYPWLALIFYNTGEFSCSGALINHNFVLTAAHCVIGSAVREKNGLKFVRLGEFNVKTQPDCIEEINYLNCADDAIDVDIDKIIVHPDYNENVLDTQDDIALIKLKNVVRFTHYIMPICLPKKNDPDTPLKTGNMFSVSGWGKTDLFNNIFLNIRSPIKLKIRVPLVSQKNCSDILRPYGAILGPKQICAGGEYARDTCAGDSGGPLMHYYAKLSRWVAYGIVSYGFTQCGQAGHPAVYTNVVEYIDWITETLLEN